MNVQVRQSTQKITRTGFNSYGDKIEIIKQTEGLWEGHLVKESYTFCKTRKNGTQEIQRVFKAHVADKLFDRHCDRSKPHRNSF